MMTIRPWHRHTLLAVGAAALLWRGTSWLDAMGRVEAASPHPSAPLAGSPSDPGLERGLAAMRMGLTELRQAATTGEPAMLQEAEKDVVTGLLDALEASVVDGRPEPARYGRVVTAVHEVEGMFKYIPYRLEVAPGGDMPAFSLLLRRSPWPLIQARQGHSAWHAAMVAGAVRLTPRAQP